MKIALFSETYPPETNGVAMHVNLLAKGLRKMGHDVLVVCGWTSARKHFVKDGVLYCPAFSFKKIYQSVVVGPISATRYKYIKNFKPDIIHIHTEFGVGFSGMSAAKFLKVPLVYTLHTMYDNYIYYIAPRKLTNIVKKTTHLYAKILAQESTCVTGPSKKVEQYFKKCGVNKPVYVIPNPVDLDSFKHDNYSQLENLKLRQRFNVAADDLLVCFCGRLGREKSVDVLLKFWKEAILNVNNYKLLIIGDGPCMHELKAFCRNSNLENKVIFTGKVFHKNLPRYYAACDLYITTSLTDTNSISMLEAMASGLPVLHLFDELNFNQIKNGVNGFFFKNSVEMKKLLDSYFNLTADEKLLLQQSARNSVMKFGDLELAKRLLKIYFKAFELYGNNKNQNKSNSKLQMAFKKISFKKNLL